MTSSILLRKAALATVSLATAGLIVSCDSGGSSAVIVERPDTVVVPEVTRLRSVASAESAGTNLLNNPDFDEALGDIPGWAACSDDSNLSQQIADWGSFVTVTGPECIQQGVAVEAGRELSLSCNIYADTTDGNPWAGLGLSFYDDQWNYISEPEAAFVANGSSSYHFVSGTVPANASNVGVWYYTESGGTVDNCVLRYTDDIDNGGSQTYDRTFTLERSRFGSYLDGVPVFYGPEYQGGYDTREKILIDGYESATERRGAEFRIAHDGEYLYFMVGINKPQWSLYGELTDYALLMDSYPVNGYLWDDDSFEIYINAGNEATEGYDQNDFVKIYGFKNVSGRHQPDTVTGFNSQLPLTHEAACNRGEYSGTYCEVRYRLDELGLEGIDNAEVGFDIQWNFDDDGGERDAKYSWCSGNTLEAWRDMSTVKCSFILSY